jgi:hypothetical protein
MGPDALPHKFRVRDEVGDFLGRAPVEFPHVGHNAVEDEASDRAAHLRALPVIILHVPEIARRRMAVAHLLHVLWIGEPLDHAGVAADDEIDRLAHAQRADCSGEKRQQLFIMARGVREILQW